MECLQVNATASDLSPTAAQLAGRAMVRALSAEIDSLWPQEEALFARYREPGPGRILVAGCGSGVGTYRLAELFSAAQVMGVDGVEVEAHLDPVRSHYSHLAPRVVFERGHVSDLRVPDDTFDLAVCRHVLQSLAPVQDVVRQMIRVTRSGGHLHLVAQDYGIIFFNAPKLREFWQRIPESFGWNTQTDLYGRRLVGILENSRMKAISLDYLVVDPSRSTRRKMIEIFEGCGNAFAEAICSYTSLTRQSIQGLFSDMIAEINDPRQYVVWLVPVISAEVGKAGGSFGI